MSKDIRANIFKHLKRVVIKIGSGVISDRESGKPPLKLAADHVLRDLLKNSGARE